MIFDVTPYWRPPEYAEGTAVIDLFQRYGTGSNVLDLVPRTYAARGALFRAITSTLMRTASLHAIDVWRRTIELLAVEI